MTECSQETFSFALHFSRRVEAAFSAGQVSSDGGALLLREVERKINLVGRLTGCFRDGRSPLFVRHQLPEMLSQRIYGLALGYEDINDHEQLRHDPLMAVLAGRRKLDDPLAGKSTLNRLELPAKPHLAWRGARPHAGSMMVLPATVTHAVPLTPYKSSPSAQRNAVIARTSPGTG